MRRWPLAAWLALSTVGVVLLVTGALAPSALGLFGGLAEESARSRVRLAALGAAEAVQREADAAATTARLLAERPTLLRLLAEHDRAALADFLERFRTTSRLDGAVIVRGDEVVAVPPDPRLEELARSARSGAALRGPLAGEAAPLAVGVAPLAAGSGGRAVVVRRLGPATAARLTEQMGVTVRVLATDADAAEAAEAGDAAAGDAAALRARQTVGDGAIVTVEVELPRLEVTRAVRPLRRTFVAVTAGASLFAVLLGLLAGRWIARPLAAMGAAAARIGAGDLATPVPHAAGAELSALSRTLDEMRLHLRSLTAELRTREAEAQALLAGIVEGVFAVDGERRIRYLNPQAAALLGLDAPRAIGRFCGDVLRPVQPEGGRPCEDRCPIVHARSRGSSRAVEHLELEGGRRTVVVTSAPMSGLRQVQVLRDETEVEAARRSRDALLASVSHELKTPLSAQLASIELLRDRVSDLGTSDASELVTALERSTLRLMRLVDNLLESVRIETGRATTRSVPVDLRVVVDEVAATIRPLLEQRGQRLDVSRLEELPLLDGDPGQLHQVLLNLLSNAHRYAPEGSAIQVGGSARADDVEIWVQDSGPGVPSALSGSIFDRFHRGPAEGQGMGLGLWIAKSIVERHRGRIAVSAADGGGARFTLRFPRAAGGSG